MRAILICPDPALSEKFEKAVAANPDVALSKRLNAYPSPDVFSRLIRTWAPEVVFLSLEDQEAASQACALFDAEFPGLQRVAIASAPSPAMFRLALRLRMRELLTDPFDASEFNKVVQDVESELDVHPPAIGCSDRFFAFMPAKAGAGASTIAANVTRTIGAVESSHALLADFDLNSGVTGFLFNVQHEFSLSDALAISNKLDHESWERLVRKVGNIDLLLSDTARLDDSNRSPKQVNELLDFLRRTYSVVTADLPDSFNETTLAVLREANRIFLVTTPELVSLRLARQKAAIFRKLELEDHVSLIVNRVTKRMELSLEEIEETLGLPVFASVPSEYSDVAKSIREAQAPRSLAPAMERLSGMLLDKRWQQKKKESRFIERFAVVPMRYGFR